MNLQMQGEDSVRLKRNGAEQAIALALESKWEEAAALNRQILASFPNDVDSWNRLGKALIELGRFRDARDAYQKSIELDPVNKIAKRNLDRLSSVRQMAVSSNRNGCTIGVVTPAAAKAARRARQCAADPTIASRSTIASVTAARFRVRSSRLRPQMQKKKTTFQCRLRRRRHRPTAPSRRPRAAFRCVARASAAGHAAAPAVPPREGACPKSRRSASSKWIPTSGRGATCRLPRLRWRRLPQALRQDPRRSGASVKVVEAAAAVAVQGSAGPAARTANGASAAVVGAAVDVADGVEDRVGLSQSLPTSQTRMRVRCPHRHRSIQNLQHLHLLHQRSPRSLKPSQENRSGRG